MRVFESQTIIWPSPTEGPGDIVPNAVAYWGLRAYSSATIGMNCCRLRRSSDNAEQDFITLSDGSVDSASINSFKGAANVFITTLYDQIGSSDAVQITAANQPQLILSGIGSNASGRSVAASDQSLNTTFNASTLSSFTLSCAVKPTTGAIEVMLGPLIGGGLVYRLDATGKQQLVKSATANIGTSGTSLSNATWASIAASYNLSDFNFYLNGSSDGSGTNVQTFISTTGNIFGRDGGTPWDGDFLEMIVWGSILNGTQVSDISANQHSYGGF